MQGRRLGSLGGRCTRDVEGRNWRGATKVSQAQQLRERPSNKHQFPPPAVLDTCAKPLHAIANRSSSSTHRKKTPVHTSRRNLHTPRPNGPPLHRPPRPTPRQRRKILPRPRHTHPRVVNLRLNSRSRHHIPCAQNTHTTRLPSPLHPTPPRLRQRPRHPRHRLGRRRHRPPLRKLRGTRPNHAPGPALRHLRDPGHRRCGVPRELPGADTARGHSRYGEG